MWLEYSYAFPKNSTASGSRRECSSNGGQWRDKGTHISTTKVSFSTNFYVPVSDHGGVVRLASFPGSSPAFCRILYKSGERAWKISSCARCRTMHGFGNRIIAHTFVNRCQFNRAGDMLTVSALDAAQHDSKESTTHFLQLTRRHYGNHEQMLTQWVSEA